MVRTLSDGRVRRTRHLEGGLVGLPRTEFRGDRPALRAGRRDVPAIRLPALVALLDRARLRSARRTRRQATERYRLAATDYLNSYYGRLAWRQARGAERGVAHAGLPPRGASRPRPLQPNAARIAPPDRAAVSIGRRSTSCNTRRRCGATRRRCRPRLRSCTTSSETCGSASTR